MSKRVKVIGIPLDYVSKALSSGFYKRKNHYTDFYMKWRLANYVIPVRQELEDDFVTEKITLLRNLDILVTDWNYKKAIAAYTLSLICPKFSGKLYIKTDSTKIILRKV